MFQFSVSILLTSLVYACTLTLTAAQGLDGGQRHPVAQGLAGGQRYPAAHGIHGGQRYPDEYDDRYEPVGWREENYNRQPYADEEFEDEEDGYEEESQNPVPQSHPLTPRIYSPSPIVPEPQPADPSIIEVPRLGRVRGNPRYKFIKNRQVQAFLGLKYGTVGRGLARFQKAIGYQYNINEPIDATREATRCPQFPDLLNITQAEASGENVDDCLTLNVYTPSLSGSYPVLVFVHGEMLFDGGAEEGQPDYLLEHDVVLVSVNYRLAPFGFLTTLTDEMPGNVALADVHMALEWVQHYIRPFGGNPDAVTLLGQAGGATLAHALSLSGKAQGMFHKLILQSGTALNPYFLDEDPLATAQTFLRFTRCSSEGDRGGVRNPRVLSDCFGRLSTTELLNSFKRHWEDNEPRGLRFTGGFKLVVGDRLGYLAQHPAALVANNPPTSYYPIIAGVAKDAGAFILSRFYDQLKQVRSRNITEFIDVVLRHTAQPKHHKAWIQLARQQIFTADDERNPTLENLAQGLLELVNLILYRGPLIDSLRYAHKLQPSFLYCFDYRGEFHRFSHLNSPLPFATDATLSDDSTYLFPYPEEVSRLNADDITVARALSSMWANFAADGMPTRDSAWPKATTEYGPLVRFTNNKNNQLEQDYHFGEGISIPNIYPEYFTTTTTTTTTTLRPYPSNANEYPHTSGSSYPPNYPNHPSYQNRPQDNPNYAQPRPPFKPYETVLNENPRRTYQQPNNQYQQRPPIPNYSRYNNMRREQQPQSGEQYRRYAQ